MTDSTWATVADVAALTGVTVTQAFVNQAAAIISQKTGAVDDTTIFPAGFISKRDMYWLKQAVCYEAAWMISQPDLFGRLDATQVQVGRADGVQLKADANVLAPLARGALKRLSWRGSRTVMDRRVRQWLLSQDLLARQRYLQALGVGAGSGSGSGMGYLDESQPQGDDNALPWSPI